MAPRVDPPDDLYAEYLRSKTAKAPEPVDEYARYLRSRAPSMRAQTDASSVTPGAGDFHAMASGVRGILASAPQAIPGVEAAQAAIRSVVRRQPYREALSDMRRETDPVPTPIKLVAQLPAMLATGRLPLSPAKAGALFGGASQALGADPIALKDRAARTVAGTAGGAITGKALDVGTTLARAKFFSPSPGKVAGEIQGRMRAADHVNYPAALAEGRQALGGQPSSTIRKVLEHPDIAPFAAQVRSSRQFANADDASVLHETFKLLGKQRAGIKQRLARDGFDAQAALEASNLGAARDDLLGAADQAMPSYRTAVDTHRQLASERDAVGTGVDAARRVMGTSPSGGRLATQSKEAYIDRIRAMAQRNRAAARQGILGELGQRTGFQPNLPSATGVLTSIQRPAKIATFMRDVGDERQRIIDYISKFGLAGIANALR